MLSKIKIILKNSGFLKTLMFARKISEYLIYKVLIIFYPKLDLQLRFLPVDKINRIINVKQRKIKYWMWMGKDKIPSEIIKYFYLDGDWDFKRKPIVPDLMKSSSPFCSIYQIFVENIPYNKCQQYLIMRNNLNNNKTKWRWKHCHTIEEIDAYFENLIKAYENIKKNGYKKQSELGGDPNDEIRVVIDREGNIIKVQGGGDHRLAIARILDIDLVPVHVVGIHYVWLLKCIEFYNIDALSAINKGLNSIELQSLEEKDAHYKNEDYQHATTESSSRNRL